MLSKIKGNWSNENGVSDTKAMLYKVKLIGGAIGTLLGTGGGIYLMTINAGGGAIALSLGCGIIAGVGTVASQVLGYDSDAGYNT